MTATRALHTFHQLRIEVGRWLRTNTRQVVVYGVLGAVGGYLLNTALLMFAYDGYVVPTGRVGVGEGNVLLGSLGVGVASTVGFSLFGYARAVGLRAFLRELTALPKNLGWLIGRDGVGARVHLLWGAALALLLRQVVGPGLGALLGLGVLVYLPSVLGQLLVRLGLRAVSALASLVRPRDAVGPGGLAVAVGILGSVAALAFAFFVQNATVLLAGALACGGAAYVLSRGGTPAQAAGIAVAVLTPAVLHATAALAWADDGGWWEQPGNRSLANWLQSAGAGTVLTWGGAAVPSAVAGGTIGGALGGLMGGGGWDFSALAGPDPGDRPTPLNRPALRDPDSDEPLVVHDGNYDGGAPGMVWYDGWTSPEEAARRIAERQAEIRQREREIADFETETERVNTGWRDARQEIYAAERDAERDLLRDREARVADRTRIDARLDRLAGSRLSDPVWMERWASAQDAAANGDAGQLAALYRETLRDEVRAGAAEASAEARYEQAMAVGEWTFRAVEMSARGAVMAVGGQIVAASGVAAGMGAAALGMGSIGGAAEGAEAQASGKDVGAIVKGTAAGFLSGAKDGAVGTITGLPNGSRAVRILLPAVTDGIETTARTGSLGRGVVSAAVSVLGGAAGEGVDAVLPEGFVRQAAGTVVNATAAGTTSVVVSGGSFQDGFAQGLAGDLVTRAGGSLGGRAAGQSSHFAGARDERAVRDAMRRGNAERSAPTTLDQQSRAVQEVAATLHGRVRVDQDGRIVSKADGDPVTDSYVDPRLALDQLRDTAGSRTGKTVLDSDAPWLREAIVRTRLDDLYGPADRATIVAVSGPLGEAGVLRPGDRLVMDPFSTPGQLPSLGADRDARLVIERPRVDEAGRVVVDTDGNPSMQRIEVAREHWEHQAEADFFRHTHAIATQGGRAVTSETHPDYYQRMRDGLERQGHPPELVRAMTPDDVHELSSDQLRHTAWAEAHNQLFTDRFHMEASRGNTDQRLQRVVGPDGVPRAEPRQGHANTLDVKAGRSPLTDPEGYARMWQEKTDFYSRNPPEALAQSQKGIGELLALRDGYRLRGQEPPPLSPPAARAMQIIAGAPVGANATPEAIARVEAALQKEGFASLPQAMHAVAWQNEMLKWSRPAPVAPPTGLRTAQIGALSRLAAIRDETTGF